MKVISRLMLVLALAAGVLAGSAHGESEATIAGIVFHDENGNGERDSGERGVKGVGVSNGVEIAVTDARGRYELPVRGGCEIFVIKPAGWQTQLDPDTNVPRFYYVHRPEGSPDLKYAGVAPTGPLPASLDFPLHRAKAGREFTAVLLGDTQPRNQQEVDYLSHDVVEELAGEEGLAFGVTLGDIVFDDLSVLDALIRSLGLVGVPWYHVIGNHDMNYDAPEAHLAYETYARFFGPPYYSFNYGDTHFIALNSIRWDTETRKYHGGLGEAQLAFLRNDLALVPKDQLVVLLMHIPVTSWEQDREALFGLLTGRPHTVSVSAHWHRQQHFFLGPGAGWHGDEPHHHVVHATACGSWWGGHFDETGIPHGTMADGAPNGHSFVTFKGSSYTMRFKAPRRPADYQMDITAPEAVARADAGGTEVVANIFAGNARSRVEMRLGNGPWTPMTQFTGKAPHALRMNRQQTALAELLAKGMGIEVIDDKSLREIEAVIRPILGRGLPNPADTDHLWKATLPASPPAGYRFIEVRATDMFGQEWTGRRVIRIEE